VLKACHLSYAVLVDVEAAQLTLSFKSTDLGETIALEVQGLQVGEELHTSQLIETFKVEVELLVELKGTVIMLPVLS